MWKELGEFTYLYKNCDKLYWTNWIETTNCNLSRHRDSVRHCEDCDGDRVDEKYCDGISTMQENCRPTWGAWIEKTCVVTSCNTNAGERVKNRECVDGDGSKARNYKLCSDDSSIVRKQCNNNTIPNECTADTLSATELDNTSLHVGIGVALALIVLLCILLAIVLYCRRKSQTNSTPSQNPALVELPVTRSIATESSGFKCDHSVVTNPHDYEQIPGSHEYGLEQPLGQPIYENSQSGFSAVNELEQLCESHAYELEQSVVPNAYEFKEPVDLNEYECASNMPHGANRPTISEPTYSTDQKHQNSTEESNEYSSLMRTSPVTESDYARLSPR